MSFSHVYSQSLICLYIHMVRDLKIPEHNLFIFWDPILAFQSTRLDFNTMYYPKDVLKICE